MHGVEHLEVDLRHDVMAAVVVGGRDAMGVNITVGEVGTEVVVATGQ